MFVLQAFPLRETYLVLTMYNIPHHFLPFSKLDLFLLIPLNVTLQHTMKPPCPSFWLTKGHKKWRCWVQRRNLHDKYLLLSLSSYVWPRQRATRAASETTRRVFIWRSKGLRAFQAELDRPARASSEGKSDGERSEEALILDLLFYSFFEKRRTQRDKKENLEE